MDATLRSELRLLHHGLLDGLDLDTALADLADSAREESGVDVRFSGGQEALTVTDDGRGVQGDEGLGLATTRERLAAVGGGLLVESTDGAGATLRAWVPVDAEGVVS